ncbi:MAG: aconitase X catalytic domain-containing protein [Nitrososphaerales archaeon]
MRLTKEEEKALNGEQGQVLAIAYRILLAIGESTEAEKLIPIHWAHVSGVNYNTIGDAGVRFLEGLDGKFRVKTTINPMGFDPLKMKPLQLETEFIRKQNRIVRAYERMGAARSFTCIPYEVFDLPPKGTDVSFAESNAAIYANSIMHLRTNKESALSALASALTGKAPYSELRIEEMRKPNKCIKIRSDLENELDYGLLGYFAGKVAKNVIAFDGINALKRRDAKALSAAIGTSGSCGMFTIGKNDVETIDYGIEEARNVKDELSNSERGDLIILGSPQLGVEDLSLLAQRIEGKKFRRKCQIFCARAAYERARDLGYAQTIERAGGELLCDCCACLTPLVDRSEVDSVITNSIKGAYYLNSYNKVSVCLKPLKEIVKQECV